MRFTLQTTPWSPSLSTSEATKGRNDKSVPCSSQNIAYGNGLGMSVESIINRAALSSVFETRKSKSKSMAEGYAFPPPDARCSDRALIDAPVRITVVWMTSSPSPATLVRVPALAWLMSQAFASNRIMAYLSVPVAVLILLPYALRRQVYESADGNGMVIFGPYRLGRDVAILAALLLPALGLYLWVLVSLGPGYASVLWAVVMGLLGIGLAGIGRGSMVMPTGPETPEGDRWQIAGLAQRPGTRLSALPLALRLRDSAPVGTVVVAVAQNDRLLEGYKRLGFTEGKERRIFWEACGR